MRTDQRRAKTKRCNKCEGTMRLSKRKRTLTVSGTEYSIPVPAWVCSRCDEVLLDGSALVRADLTIATEIASEGPINAETLRFMRRALAMRATELAQLLDVRAETLSHWETGHTPTPRAAWMMLSEIVLDKAAGGNATRERIEAAIAHRQRRGRVALTLLAIAGLAVAAATSKRRA